MSIKRVAILKNFKSSEGAALAMVLIFIVVLSLWMLSIATLIRSGNSSVQSNKQQNLLRSTVINEVIPQALAKLTKDGFRYGIDDDPGCEDALSPNGNPVEIPISNGDIAYVECAQAPKSGTSQPVASFVLTGGNCYLPSAVTDCASFTSSTQAEIGKDGGLKLDTTLNPLEITGGIINVSGAWQNVSDATLKLSQVCPTPGVTYCPTEPFPKILQPISSPADCPATNYTVSSGSSSNVQRCQCPISTLADSTQCPTGTDAPTFATLDPQDPSTDLSNYLDSILGSLSDVAPSNLAKVPSNCLSPITTVVGSNTLFSIQVSPGTIDSTVRSPSTTSLIQNLNTILACGGDGKTSSKPAIQFLPGTYRFNLASAGTAANYTNSSTTSIVINADVSVIGGNPKFDSPNSRWICESALGGVQFQMQNASYFFLRKGFVSLCPLSSGGNQPLLVAPSRTKVSSNAGNIASFYWQGARLDPIIRNAAGSAGGCSVCMDLNGLVFVPGGYIDINLNGDTKINFNKGIVTRALSITGTGSASSGGSIAPPPPFNGDRVIQLKIKSQKLGNLGVVQVVIRDYFGRRLAAGYKILSWRTQW